MAPRRAQTQIHSVMVKSGATRSCSRLQRTLQRLEIRVGCLWQCRSGPLARVRPGTADTLPLPYKNRSQRCHWAPSPALPLAARERSQSLALSQHLCTPHVPLAAISTQRLKKQQEASQEHNSLYEDLTQCFKIKSVQLRPIVLKITLQCRAVSGGGGTAKD